MGKDIVAILMAVIIVAIIAVLVSKNAQTSTVIGSIFSGYANVIKTAVSPVSNS